MAAVDPVGVFGIQQSNGTNGAGCASLKVWAGLADMVILDARGIVDDLCSSNRQPSVAFGTVALSDR